MNKEEWKKNEIDLVEMSRSEKTKFDEIVGINKLRDHLLQKQVEGVLHISSKISKIISQEKSK